MTEPDNTLPPLFVAPEEPDPDALTSETPEKDQDTPFSVEVDAAGVDLFDRTEEEALTQAATGRSKENTPPPMPDDIDLGDRNPGMTADPTRGVVEDIINRFRTDVEGAVVEVTAGERDAFVRSALHDTEMVFSVPVAGVGSVVEVAVPSDLFTSLASATAYHWGKLGFIDPSSDMQWILAFQQLHVWYQVRSIDNVPTPWSDFWRVDTPPATAEIRNFMRRPSNFESITGMKAVRWRMVMDAVRTAEEKYKICLKNWHNRSFFTGADTA
jgi:hypothetical protein